MYWLFVSYNCSKYYIYGLIESFWQSLAKPNLFFIDKFVSFKEKVVPLWMVIFHLAIKSQHFFIYSPKSSSYLPSYWSNCITVSSHIRILHYYFKKWWWEPYSMQSHSECIHAVWTYISWLLFKSAWRISEMLVFPIPVAVFRLLIECFKLLICLATLFVVFLGLLHAFCQKLNAWNIGFKVIANPLDEFLAVFTLFSVNKLDYNVSHKTWTLFSL